MKDKIRLQERAGGLMRVALSMLDEAGDKSSAAAHLQMALDSLMTTPPSAPGDHALRGAALSDPAMVRAVGGALAVLGRLLEGKGIVQIEELSNLLGIYAAISRETSPDEGLILGCWAGMLRDAAQGQGDGVA